MSRRPAFAVVLLAGICVLAAAGLAVAALEPRSIGSFQLDRSFGHGGLVLAPGRLPPTSPAATAAGKGRTVTVVDGPQDVELARYLPNGRLDPSFGSGGAADTGVSSDYDVRAAMRDSRGRILVAGAIQQLPSVGPGFVARFRPDGELDPSFGDDGVTTSGIQAFYAIAVDGHDRALAAGYFGHGHSQMAVARFDQNGSLDTRFGNGGTVELGSAKPSKAFAVAIDDRGRVLLAGQRVSDRPGGPTPERFALARLRPDGSPDPAFGAHGRVEKTTGSGRLRGRGLANGIYSVGIAPNGDIVAAGDASFRRTSWDFTVVRYRPNGGLVRGFGHRGTAHTSFGLADHAAAVAIDDGGRITVAGTGMGPCGRSNCTGFGIARFDSNGSPEPGFGSRGRARTPIGCCAAGTALVPQPGHRAVLAGYSTIRHTVNERLALVGYSTRPLRP
jgi:uncharacterized delta-60 repeat protein